MKLKLTTKSQIEKRPARTTAAMLLQMKITTSCPNNAKPNVVCRNYVVVFLFTSPLGRFAVITTK